MSHSSFRCFFLAGALLLAGCGGGTNIAPSPAGGQQASAPVVTTRPAQNGATIVTLTTATPGATIYYTLDGSTPTTNSSVYQSPFLLASEKLNAVAAAPAETPSTVTSKEFSLAIPAGTLVWSDEFDNSTGTMAQPDPTVWAYESGAGGWGNNELETYCAWNASVPPCSTSSPSVYVGTDGSLHIVAHQPSPGVYTSARLKTQGLFSFQSGRLEVRAQLPEAQGLWPAVWLLGNNIATVNWPACGEQDVVERVNAATVPDWIKGSIHGTGFTGTSLGTVYQFGSGDNASGWHTYGMTWSKGSISYYVDDPSSPYVTYTTSSLAGGAGWPFDSGGSFILINLAVGGTWPGSPNSTTPFPAQMLIDYVRIYTN